MAGLSLGPDYPPVEVCSACAGPVLAGEDCAACAAGFEAERRILAAVREDPRPGETVTVRFTVVKTATRDRTYSTVEVCSLTGLSYRQVDYWIRCGVLGDSDLAGLGSGRRRRFSAGDVDVLRAVAGYLRLARPEGRSVVGDAASIEAAVRDAPPGGWLVVTDDEAAVVHHAGDLAVVLGRCGGIVVALPALDEIPADDPDLLSASTG